ncbi:hypothetical protein [Aquimarina agarilytica]|uniref:hypothetical protein n=1 Tax=Aquimarina agarilytica TaxID=1087449 RepID=UPI0002887FAD|nr:hypothetical protein [Aquimarina agarilytica]
MTLTLKTLKRSTALAALGLCSFKGFSQILTSGFYPDQGKLTIATSYTYKQSDDFWAGSNKRPGNPAGLGEITSDIFNLYAEYGITDKISIDVNIPYIKNTSGTGQKDPVLDDNEISGVQDLNIFAKFKIFEKSGDGFGRFNLGFATGIGLPLSDYEGEGVLSIGNEATSYNFDFIAQYELPMNLFIELQGGSSVRDSDEFNIPSTLSYGAKIGYFHKYFYVHAELDFQDSVDGLDIGTPEFMAAGGPAILPETEVDFTSLGFSAYVPIYKDHWGVSAGYTTTLDGRNFSNESSFSFGVIYQNLFHKKTEE